MNVVLQSKEKNEYGNIAQGNLAKEYHLATMNILSVVNAGERQTLFGMI